MKRFVFTLLGLCLLSAGVMAQSNTGNLVGTVSDTSGSIPGATVTVTDNKTGRERSVVTTDSGAFSIPQLETGTHTVKVTAAGHKSFTATEVKIDVGKDYTLNVVLEVGEISENVTVVAGTDIINASSGELSTTVSPRQIVELPLNGRNPLSLVLLQAGTSSNSAQNTTINGQRSSFTNITRDGINVQDNFIRANAVDFLPDRPNVDDTGEFTIITQNAGAESGFGSSQVQLVTPRGSSEFHGALFLFNRNSNFAANTFFNNFSRVARPFLNRNQFGGKLGGPLPLPRFGEGGASTIRDRAFFFGAYEGFRLRQSASANRTILLPNARQGIFTYRDGTGAVRTANIFALAAALPGAPPTGIDPLIASRILANVPTAGNNATLGDQLNTTGLTLSRQQNQDREAFTTRFDFDVTSNSTINAVYSYKKELLFRTDVDAQQGGTACCYTQVPPGFQDAHTKFLALAWRWSPTTALTNELRGGWQGSDPRFGNKGEPTDFFIQIPLINNPESAFQPQGRRTNTYNLQDNAVWVRGSHSVRFGGQFQAFRAAPFGPGAFGAPSTPNYVLGGGSTPAFNVTSFNAASGCVSATGANCINSAQVTTANSLLALLGGLVGSANQTFTAGNQQGPLAPVPPSRQLFFEHYSFYGSDQWRVSPTLTVNFGMRYELFTPLREPNGLALEPVLQGGDILATILNPNGTYNFVGTNNGGTNFFKIDKNNFAPVASFAWSPNTGGGFLSKLMPGEGRTVIRGGYRMSYVNDEFIRAADNALANNAGLTQGLITTGNFRLNARPTFTPPALQVPRTYAQNNAVALNFGTVFAIDPDLAVPRTQEFNIGIERELGWDTAFEIRYVNGRSSNLVRGLDFNQVRIFGNGFIEDAERARQNRRRGLAANCTAGTPGCQPLQLLNQAPFNNSVFGNPLGFANTLNPIDAGNVGELAFVYLATFRVGSNVLLNNPNTGVADLLLNGARFRYNALQTEVRRRFTDGLTFQANYTFQKALTDAPGTGQTRFEPLIDNALPNLEYGIADTDTTHVFNLNGIYEMPFGRGKKFFTDANGFLNRVIGGWQVTSIVRIDSGAPFSITDPRGTLNRTLRSGRQTANTNLTKDEIKALVGVFRTPCGIFFINPQVINLDLGACDRGVVAPRVTVSSTGAAIGAGGQAALGFDQGTFPGQVFFNVAPGKTGTLERNFVSGPTFLNWDASLIKNIPISENVRFQIRAEVFNVLNRSNFSIANQFTQANINSTTFGRLLGTFPPRIVQFAGRLEF